jgi:hypothetical protein
VKERPIIMRGPEVRAILDGTKTQARLPIGLDTLQRSETPGYDWTWRGQAPIRSIAQQRLHPGGCWQDVTSSGMLALCPYGSIGERLWVRESFAYSVKDTEAFHEPGEYSEDTHDVVYRATNEGSGEWDLYDADGQRTRIAAPWRSPTKMPRWASRILLELAEVSVQRLQDVSEEDANAEIGDEYHGDLNDDEIVRLAKAAGCMATDCRAWFAAAWEMFHGRGSWDVNPWVWAMTFKRVNL